MKKTESSQFEEKQSKLLRELDNARARSDLFKYDRVLKQLHQLRSQKEMAKEKPMAKKKKVVSTVEDIDSVLDDLGIKKGQAREKAKTYCAAKIKSLEGQCLPTEDLRSMASAYFDGFSESLRGG